MNKKANLYELSDLDNHLITTIVSLLYKNQRTETSTSLHLIRENVYSKVQDRRTPGKLYFRLDFPETDKEKIIQDYALDRERLKETKLTKILQQTHPVITLKKYSNLIAKEEIDTLVKKYEQDSDLKLIIDEIAKVESEFSTESGEGISLKTLNSWIENIKQKSFDLNQAKERYKTLSAQIEEFDTVERTQIKQDNPAEAN